MDQLATEPKAPIKYAFEHGHTKIVKLLLQSKAGSLFQIKSFDEESPLVLATQMQNEEMIDLILEQSIKTDIFEKDCFEACCVASKLPNSKIFWKLVHLNKPRKTQKK